MAELKKHSSLGITLQVDEYTVTSVTSIPDMGGSNEKIETTCLSDSVRTYIPGIRDLGDLSFEMLYESGVEGNYAKLTAKEKADKDVEFTVTFPDGATFKFSGRISLRILGVGVNAAITFAMDVALSSDIVYSA